MVMFCFLSCLTDTENDCGADRQKRSAEQHLYKMEIYPTQ